MGTGTENRILEAAIELFAQHGYAASAREIAAHADSTTMTMYRAFRNKKAHLFMEALEAVIKRSFDPGQFMLFIYEDHKPGGGFISVLRAGLERWYFAMHWYSARLMAHACLSENRKWRATANTALERIVGILATSIERQLPRAHQQEVDAHATAKAVIMLLFNMRWMRASRTPSAKAEKEEAREIEALLNHSLKALAAAFDDDATATRRTRR